MLETWEAFWRTKVRYWLSRLAGYEVSLFEGGEMGREKVVGSRAVICPEMDVDLGGMGGGSGVEPLSSTAIAVLVLMIPVPCFAFCGAAILPRVLRA